MYSAEPLFLEPCSIRKELIDLLGSEPQYREFPTKGILVCRNLFWRFCAVTHGSGLFAVLTADWSEVGDFRR